MKSMSIDEFRGLHGSPKVSVSDENLMGFGNTRHGRNAPGSY